MSSATEDTRVCVSCMAIDNLFSGLYYWRSNSECKAVQKPKCLHQMATPDEDDGKWLPSSGTFVMTTDEVAKQQTRVNELKRRRESDVN